MSAHSEITHRSSDEVTIQVRIPLTRSLLDTEMVIRDAVNQVGCLATAEAIRQLDTDGRPLQIGKARVTCKKTKLVKTYLCPYGHVPVERYVYQGAGGGRTYVPVEVHGRFVYYCTPALARQLMAKMAMMSQNMAHRDMELSGGYSPSTHMFHKITSEVMARLAPQQQSWDSYRTPPQNYPVQRVRLVWHTDPGVLIDAEHRPVYAAAIGLFDAQDMLRHTVLIMGLDADLCRQRVKNEMQHLYSMLPDTTTYNLRSNEHSELLALCRSIIDERIRNHGSHWSAEHLGYLLTVEEAIFTTGAWKELWARIERYGLPDTAGPIPNGPRRRQLLSSGKKKCVSSKQIENPETISGNTHAAEEG